MVAFSSKTLDVYDIADAMSAKGWHLNSLQTPPAIHVAVTLPVAAVWEKLVADLEAVIEGEKEKERDGGNDRERDRDRESRRDHERERRRDYDPADYSEEETSVRKAIEDGRSSRHSRSSRKDRDEEYV